MELILKVIHAKEFFLFLIFYESPLFTAVKYNRVEMFRVLIRKGADVNKINLAGLTPIDFAVMDENSFLTDSLLYYGANPAHGTLNPYLYAFRAGEKEIANNIEIVAPTLATTTKLSPEIFQVIKEDNVAQLNKLLIKGFDVNIIDVLEGAPLHCAVEYNSIKCAILLVDNGANINIPTIQRNETPLLIAIRKNYVDIYYYLLGLPDIDLSLCNKDVLFDIFFDLEFLFYFFFYENALFYAVRQNNLEILNDILLRGDYVNEINHAGLTPLYVAVSLKEPEMVRALLDNNANPTHEVHPSFKLAQEMDSKEIATILSEAGARDISTRSARADARRTRGTDTTPNSRLAQSSLIKTLSPKTRSAANSRFSNPPARRARSRMSQFNDDGGQLDMDDEIPKPHTEGMCYICERNKGTQKLIPCSHVVSCRGCIKKFIEEHLPCPVCKLSFYATSTVQEGQ